MYLKDSKHFHSLLETCLPQTYLQYGPVFLCQFPQKFSHSIITVGICPEYFATKCHFQPNFVQKTGFIFPSYNTQITEFTLHLPLVLQQQHSIFLCSKQSSAQVGRKMPQDLQTYKLPTSSALPIQVHDHNNKTHKKIWLGFRGFSAS